VNGVDVDIVPTKGNTVCMLSRAGIGKIIKQNELLSFPNSVTPKSNLKPRQNLIAVRMEMVLAPGMLIPNFTVANHSNPQKATLHDFGKTPFNIVLPLKMLRNHENRENVPITMDEIQPILDRTNDPGDTINRTLPAQEGTDNNDGNDESVAETINPDVVDREAEAAVE
jgi:hypothetical protein